MGKIYYNYNPYINSDTIFLITSIVVAIVGGIAVYFTYLNKKNEYNGFLKILHDFLNFKLLIIENILKLTYLILAVFITLYSFIYIGISFISFLSTLLLGNLILRISYELILLLIKICKNIEEINGKMKK
ncbi:MAG: hypothetical protein IJZ36_00090 [Bacilli bacterium]|nr:hypothetical protein [Bacilli bacterium]